MLYRAICLSSHQRYSSLQHRQTLAPRLQANQARRHTAIKKAPIVPIARPRSSHVTNVAKGLLAEIEALKSEADCLESELQQASRVAEVAAKRSRRLANRSHELQAYALEHILLGDELAARAALLQKASVADALVQATRRAEANSALARKLEEVLTAKQAQLLQLITEAKQQTDAEVAAAAADIIAIKAADAAEAEDSSSNRGLKRSRSVAWSSATLHASSDGLEQQLLQQQDLQQEQQSTSDNEDSWGSVGSAARHIQSKAATE